MVELGRVDIHTEVFMLGSFLAMPRKGHLEAAIGIMSYIRDKHNSWLYMDLTYPDIDTSKFNDGAEWKEFYGDAKEAIPHDAPEPKGKEVVLRMFVVIVIA